MKEPPVGSHLHDSSVLLASIEYTFAHFIDKEPEMRDTYTIRQAVDMTRLKRVRVTHNELLLALYGWRHLDYVCMPDGTSSEIPSDVTVVDVVAEPHFRGFTLTISHPDFPVVAECQEIPLVDDRPVFKMVKVIKEPVTGDAPGIDEGLSLEQTEELLMTDEEIQDRVERYARDLRVYQQTIKQRLSKSKDEGEPGFYTMSDPVLVKTTKIMDEHDDRMARKMCEGIEKKICDTLEEEIPEAVIHNPDGTKTVDVEKVRGSGKPISIPYPLDGVPDGAKIYGLINFPNRDSGARKFMEQMDKVFEEMREKPEDPDEPVKCQYCGLRKKRKDPVTLMGCMKCPPEDLSRQHRFVHDPDCKTVTCIKPSGEPMKKLQDVSEGIEPTFGVPRMKSVIEQVRKMREEVTQTTIGIPMKSDVGTQSPGRPPETPRTLLIIDEAEGIPEVSKEDMASWAKRRLEITTPHGIPERKKAPFVYGNPIVPLKDESGKEIGEYNVQTGEGKVTTPPGDTEDVVKEQIKLICQKVGVPLRVFTGSDVIPRLPKRSVTFHAPKTLKALHEGTLTVQYDPADLKKMMDREVPLKDDTGQVIGTFDLRTGEGQLTVGKDHPVWKKFLGVQAGLKFDGDSVSLVELDQEPKTRTVDLTPMDEWGVKPIIHEDKINAPQSGFGMLQAPPGLMNLLCQTPSTTFWHCGMEVDEYIVSEAERKRTTIVWVKKGFLSKTVEDDGKTLVPVFRSRYADHDTDGLDAARSSVRKQFEEHYKSKDTLLPPELR